MKYALTLPPFGELSDPAALVEVALVAESAGWDEVLDAKLRGQRLDEGIELLCSFWSGETVHLAGENSRHPTATF